MNPLIECLYIWWCNGNTYKFCQGSRRSPALLWFLANYEYLTSTARSTCICHTFICLKRRRDSLLAKCCTHDQKVASLNPSRGSGRIFFSKDNFVCWILFSILSTPVWPQWYVKEPCHSAKSAGGRLHLNTHVPLTWQSQSGLTMPLSRHSVGTYQETNSHATCQGTFGHSHLSSLSHCGLILA